MRIVTKELLKKLGACTSSYDHVCKNGYIGLTYKKGIKKCILEKRFSDANWFVVRIMNKKQKVQYAIFAAELVLHIYEKENDSNAPRKAIEAAKAYLKSPSKKTMEAAYAAAASAYASAAYAAAYAAASAYASAYASADAAASAASAAADVKEEIYTKILEYGISLI